MSRPDTVRRGRDAPFGASAEVAKGDRSLSLYYENRTIALDLNQPGRDGRVVSNEILLTVEEAEEVVAALQEMVGNIKFGKTGSRHG